MTSPNLAQQAYKRIQHNLLSGVLPPGSVISEAAVAKELGISRTPVGEAIRQLARDGLMRQVPRFGTIVRSPDKRELVEQYETREALESFAVAMAAKKMTPRVLERLTSYCDVMSGLAAEVLAAGLSELNLDMLHRFLAADMAFHMLIIESAGNRRILAIVQDMRTISRIFGVYRGKHDHALVVRANESHRGILDALRAGDSDDARRLMAAHISDSMRKTLDQMDTDAADRATDAFGLPDELVADLDAIEQSGKISE